MTGRRHTFHQMMTLLWAVGVAASVAGCGRTLAFVERDGVNLAIRANASSSPPIEVNFGLNRTVATIVPPAGQSGGQPNGEAVSMFAGFQIQNDYDVTKQQVSADLKIDTQFASGAAAVNVATSPPLVARIVNVNSTTIQRALAFVDTLGSESNSLRRSRVFPMLRWSLLLRACCQLYRQGLRTFRRIWRRTLQLFAGAARSRRRWREVF